MRSFPLLFAGALALLGRAPIAQATPCARFAEGSVIANPPEVASVSGLLNITLNFNTFNDSGNVRYCYETDAGWQGPTLRVYAGDRVVLTLVNNLPPSPPATWIDLPPLFACGGTYLDPHANNLHFHGMHLPPVCHQDNAVTTIVNPGASFVYDFTIPPTHPAGVFWYHPHIFGTAQPQVKGGASGLVIVEGLQNYMPQAALLDERIVIIRDTDLPVAPVDLSVLIGLNPSVPADDISVNYIPIAYAGLDTLPTDQYLKYTPAVMEMRPGEQQLWRIVNSAATTSLVLQLQYDGVPQPFTVVALDGKPLADGQPLTMVNLTTEAATRFDVIVTAPASSVASAVLWTLRQNAGILGDANPPRPIFRIVLNSTAAIARTMPAALGGAPLLLNSTVESVMGRAPAASRLVYFDEDNTEGQFFMVVQGMAEVPFAPGQSPSIIATSDTVEDWVVENHSEEEHEFHIHQIHFVVYQVDHTALPSPQFYDTYRVPAWTGSGPYPSITLRMDFSGPIAGDFVFHCHILEHEDAGMMALIRIRPAIAASTALSAADTALIVISTLTAVVGVCIYWAYRREVAQTRQDMNEALGINTLAASIPSAQPPAESTAVGRQAHLRVADLQLLDSAYSLSSKVTPCPSQSAWSASHSLQCEP